MHERSLIEAIADIVPPHPLLSVGIGDDCAVLKPHHKPTIITQDMLIEDSHFTLASTTAQALAHKALGVNVSDIAAMGAEPYALSLGLSLPSHCPSSYVLEFVRGLADECKHYHIAITGGDTCRTRGPLTIAITLLGTPLSEKPILRSGAQPGDKVWVSGPLGGSFSSGHHLTFTPRLDFVKKLLPSYLPTAMIDLSDGLGSDIRHILRQSCVGADLDLDSIPIRKNLSSCTRKEQIARVFCDGEDFELCFTLAPEDAARLSRDSSYHNRCFEIGVITSEENRLRDVKTRQPISYEGYEHRLGED